MKLRFLAGCAALLVLFAAGCTKNNNNKVVAKVNNGTITVGEFKQQLDELQPRMQEAVATDSKARKDFLDDLIGIELVLQEARREKLDKDPEFKKRQEAMRLEMEQRLKDAAKNDLFNAVLKKELMDKLKPPTDEEVKAYYESHRDEIRKAAGGKSLTLKQAEAQGLKRYVFQMKQRDAYLDYAKTLRAKAKITIDEKVLDALASQLATTGLHGTLQLTPPQAGGTTKNDEPQK